MSSQGPRSIPLAKPVFDAEMEAAALDALRNERFVMGESVCKFEEEFARYIGTRYAVSTSSGTNALQIAVLALGVKGEVVTSDYSFVASANAVLHAGCVPVLADIDAGTFCVDPGQLRKRVGRRSGALLPVHLYGYPCAMDEVRDLAADHDLRVVEDACQAHGAEYVGRRCGSLGDVGCFSFYPSKNMTVCGDGGMITTNDEGVAKLAAKLRDCGRRSQYEHDVVGFTSRLNTVSAAVGRVQLKRLSGWNRRRLEVAGWYDEGLAGVESVVRPPGGSGEVRPVYHLYVIRAEKRDGLREHLRSKGVATGVHYPLPISLQPIYVHMYHYRAGDFPLSEQASRECLSLPMGPWLSKDDVKYVCGCVREFYGC